GVGDADWLHGLKVVAVAVVAQAVWGMAKSLAPDRARASFAIIAALVVLASRTATTQVLVIVAAGVLGWMMLPVAAPVPVSIEASRIPRGKGLAAASLAVFLI